jgi:hypothetical protein
MAVMLLFAAMLALMLMRVYLPIGAKARGKVTSRVSLSLMERFLLQRVNLYAIGGVLLLMIVTGSMSTAGELLVLLVAQGILMIPVRCVITSEGVGLNNVVFRPWSEFVGFTVAPRRIVLVGREGTRSMSIPLYPRHQQEIIPALRRHLPEVKAEKQPRAEHSVTAG